jgi:flagellum-specific peptidoglycan hydrolase FlgJ
VITPAQQDFLKRSYAAGLASQHPFPGYAAAETALESAWGTDAITVRGNDLFGQKAGSSTAGNECIYCDTKEEGPHGHWYTAHATWPIFASWTDSYNARIALLRHLAPEYPATYGAALQAKTGEDFVRRVSLKWSTWTGRAAAVLSIYNSHRDLLGGIQ